MSDHGSSSKAILYAFIANLGIALAKLGAALIGLAITMQMGPDVMLALKVRMRAGMTLDDAVGALNALGRRIKMIFPEVAWIFVEPHVAD